MKVLFPSDRNIEMLTEVQEGEKRSSYLDLLSELRKLYPGFKIKLVLIIDVLRGVEASFKKKRRSCPPVDLLPSL